MKIRSKLCDIRDFYQSLSSAVKASLWFTVCNIVEKGIALLSTPIFTRILTTDQFGVYTVYQSWYQIITIFATLNLYCGVFNNGLLKFEKNRDVFTSAIQGLSTTITVTLFLVYLVSKDFWNSMLGLNSLYICMIFVELLFVPAYLFWSTRERFSYRYKKIIITTIIIALGSPLLGVVAVLNTEYKAEARVISYVLVQVCIGIIFYIFNAKKGKKFFDANIWLYALAFNIPLIPHYLAFSLLNQVDRIMISKIIDTGTAAIYSVAYSISMMMNIITNAINNSFIPYTYKKLKEKEYDDIKTNTNLLLVVVGSACIVAIAFSPEIIQIFASSEYYDAIWVMPPLAASVYFMFLYPLFGNIEFYFEKTKYVTIASCIGAIANVILNFIFIRFYGYYAAAYTTLFCYILFAFAHYFFYRKVLAEKIKEIDNIYDIKFIVVFSVIILFIMIGMTLVYKLILVRYSIIVFVGFIAFLKRKMVFSQIIEIRKK
ncbi:lipopolysaccharide biosynthesis protein [Sporolactobacillus spathodeae]|uniref:O-antigen/teichoic acid export membrane protein n=1 Tax=Sporolactobacillus spathodeae TaxID=1465502 RepID=A0ABS2Q7W8_9BACL|nr:oligosaccharide flippase family protein [Sporolactobacillus spathodeae]MBM7657751.1 O-antigen/teichoic acid export membrane protein [Sporolactobacillus spathodeae]